MFANTLDIHLDGNLEGTPVTLKRVNQDNYGSEYRYRGTDESVKLLIRHSEEKPSKGSLQKVLRHNIFIERKIFPLMEGKLEQVYTSTFTFRQGEYDDIQEMIKLFIGSCQFVAYTIGTGVLDGDN